MREFTRIQPVPFVPEIQLHLADRLVPLWEATEWRAAAPQAPPFWAFVWPGSQAIARFLLDNPATVSSRRVLDFGAGSGLAAIAAVRCGANSVSACDLDPLAAAVQELNAALNGVSFARYTCDAVSRDWEVDLILAGDVCYEREPAETVLAWLRQQVAIGRTVLLADPGRHYAPTGGLDVLATYDVPTLRELESAEHKRTLLGKLSPLFTG